MLRCMTKLFASCVGLLLLASQPQAATPLTIDQIREAIRYGEGFKSRADYLQHGMKGVRVKLASAMAMDGISKYATFYGDWDAVAASAADAKREMRTVRPEEITSTGLIYALVEVHGRGAIPTSKLDRRYLNGHAHLVLRAGDKKIQPVEKSVLNQNDQSTAGVLMWGKDFAQKDTLEFAFDVTPADLDQPVEVILIDGDGHQHKAMATLSMITPPRH